MPDVANSFIPVARRRQSLSGTVCARLLCVASALLLGACADAPPETDPSAPVQMGGVTVPQSWHNAGSDVMEADASQSAEAAQQTETERRAQLADWWRQFDDPVLDELIETALVSNPGVRTALSRIEESRARRGIALSPLLPMLSGKVSGSGSSRRNHDLHRTSNSENYGASLNMSWEIDLFGRQQLALDAASADLLQTEENFYAAQVALVAEVAGAYVQLRAAQAQLDVLLRNIAARMQTTELTQWRAQAGETSELEVRQAQSTLEQARAAIPSVEQSIALARNQLALLCGKTPGALDALLDNKTPVPVGTERIAVGIPLDTLRQRPDVRAAEQALLASEYRTRSAERERLPAINLSASIGVEALRAGNLFSPEATVASLVGGLTAPLFQGGRISQTIAVSEAQQEQARIAYEQVILTALAEVENALIGVRQGMDRLAVLRHAEISAQIAATLAAQKYEAGQTDLLTVLEAQRTQLSIEEQTVNTSASLTTSHIQLYKALGGGWTPLPQPDADTQHAVDTDAPQNAAAIPQGVAAAADHATGAQAAQNTLNTDAPQNTMDTDAPQSTAGAGVMQSAGMSRVSAPAALFLSFSFLAVSSC